MEFTQLRYFLAVAESQKVTATAQKLNIAQPALTQSIHRLEKELGVPLFVQRGRNIVITEYGKYLQAQLLPVMETLEGLPERLRAMAHLENETIHINVLAASTAITDAIIRYKQAHPTVNFQLLQNEKEEMYDICVSTKLFFQNDAAPSVCSFHEEIFLAVPRNSRFGRLKFINLEDVAEEGFISLAGSKQFRAICDRFCKQAGFAPKIIFESDNPTSVRNLIAANLGIGFWPEYTWGKLESNDVVLLPIANPVCRRDIVITKRENKADNKNVNDFYEFLRHSMAELLNHDYENETSGGTIV